MTLLSRRAALLAPAVAALPTGAVAAAHPDAELIQICAEYIAKVAEYNASTFPDDEDDDPAWEVIEDLRDRASEIEPQTIAGVVALAKVAESQGHVYDDGTVSWSDSFTGDWPRLALEGLLRIAGEAPR